MSVAIKLLGPTDAPLLAHLALNDPAFDLDGRGEPLEPLSPSAALRFLADPAVLFWVAKDGDEVAGFLYCLLVPLRSSDEQELLLYEIGVRDHLTKKVAIDMIGPEGIETEEVSKRDIFHRGDQFGERNKK